MKTLLLLRHAKSSHKGADTPDHDRPLNQRGERDALRMGRLLREENLVPGLVLSSTARRARLTTTAVMEETGVEVPLEYHDELYLAYPDDMTALLRDQDDEHAAILLVGHNPGFEGLVRSLTGKDEHFPTAGLAVLRVGIDRWGDLRHGVVGVLETLYRPRELAQEGT